LQAYLAFLNSEVFVAPKTISVESCNLAELKPGQKAGIVCAECGQDVSARMEEMGFVPGADVEVIKTGCPLMVRIGDAKVCLREEQAKGVTVLLAS
jgi:Fe2+ transport system protein FeoA